MQWKLKDDGVAERISDLSSEDKSQDKCTEVERGVVQVHKSSPSEIYGTIQDGRTGRSFRLVRTDGHNWKLSYNDKDNSTKKLAIVEKVKGKWLLYTKDKSRVLGTHDTAKEAYGQEYAIEKSEEKSASAQGLQEYLYSYVPRAGIAQIKEHGLLSGNEIAKPENRRLLELARPNGDADRWLKEKDERLAKDPWLEAYNGPSVLFGDLDPDKIHDKHPIKKFDAARIKIKLTNLLKDYPDTRMEGSELIPYTSHEAYDALDEKGKDEFVHNRHHTLSPEEIKSLIARGQNPKDMWKDFKDTEGKFYASDVPHAHLITSIGKIPSKYIEFDEEQPVTKQAGLLKKSIHWSDDVSRNILNGRHYPVSYLTGELDELKESIKNRDWNNFKEEVGDSTYAAEMILAQRLGLNLPLIGASNPVEKFYARKKKWEEVFDERGVPFNNDYLSGGSNLKKPKKIQAALGLAGHAITKDEARALALKYGGEIEDDWIDNNSLSKVAEAQPRHELVIGASGAGKTTKAKELSEQNGMPVINLDKTDPAWHNFIKDNGNLRNENNVPFHLIEGTKTNLQWKKLMRRIVDEAMAKKEPHIIEGTHLMMLSPKELQNHNLHIVNPSLEEVVQRRENRMRQKEVEKGRHYTKDDYENNRLFATAFYDKIQPAIKKWEKVDSKLKNRINPTLVTQINNKVAALLSPLSSLNYNYEHLSKIIPRQTSRN